MSEAVTLAIVAGVSAIAGSAITGWFTYLSAVRQREAERYKRRLLRTYKDIAAFHRLEERYTNALATESKSAESWKREMRRLQSAENFATPSEDATARKAEQHISELE
ncbi:MAG: hypothetical protein WA917_02910 [Comamonas sp.]